MPTREPSEREHESQASGSERGRGSRALGHAHGKVILLGEHAVVYGIPALCTGIERGASAVAGWDLPEPFTINDSRPDSDMAHQALAALRQALAVPEVRVAATLELMPGAGLGASAALGVAIARALALHGGLGTSAETVLRGAEAWEKVFHGNPSGIDTTAAYHGGCFKFRRGHPASFLTPPAGFKLAIAKAGPPASTKAMVDSVARLRQRRPTLFDKSMEGIRSLVENAALCLGAADLEGLGKLMDYNQMLLSGLFLSTPEIEDACRIAREAGALGAKLTGAGGGGAVIALAREPESIVEAWQAQGVSGFVAVCCQSPDDTPEVESSGAHPGTPGRGEAR